MHDFFAESSLAGRFADGWAIRGITVLRSGLPYSIIDYSGAVGSVYYGVSDGITNPIVPLAPGCTPKNVYTGNSGAVIGLPTLNPNCFTLRLLAPGALGGAIPPNDFYETNFTTGQRNIFRQLWQTRADISVVKTTKLSERSSLKYTFDVFNLTNTPSFDIPITEVEQNLLFNPFPIAGTPPIPTSCDFSNQGFYACLTVSGLGLTNMTIGRPWQIQLSMTLLF